ncbi:hypothetical protein [Niveispirillum sp.]|uniref:hypothetical protein n=1 Tax=Niveispirillum sp. TaxID=1917217 RepID=UPI001B46BB3D|nr:hypothetical protein [Niveispirillum sp.]MBP7339320.1 hypothetical protein [Niveispirillum sp.]
MIARGTLSKRIARVCILAIALLFGAVPGSFAREVEFSPPVQQNPEFQRFAGWMKPKLDYLIKDLGVPELAYVAVQEPTGRLFLFEYLQPGASLNSWRRMVSVNTFLIGNDEEMARQGIGKVMDLYVAEWGTNVKNVQRQKLPTGDEGFYGELTVGEGAIAEDIAVVIRRIGVFAVVIMNQKRDGTLSADEKFATHSILSLIEAPAAP